MDADLLRKSRLTTLGLHGWLVIFAPCVSQRAKHNWLILQVFSALRRAKITDDNLWRPTRRAKEHYTKNNLWSRRGAVHSIG